ncbi:MAG: hypothetical protein LUQ25_08085 [Methanoregulaceae archaeon]|nr:hypothetical protein [Methanoregulaceae archaeon]
MSRFFRPENEEALKRRLEVFAVVLIALSTVLSSWCVYEAARWGGHQSLELSNANAYRSESVRATDVTTAYVIVDTQLFLSWVDAVGSNRTAEAAFIRERFRPEFVPALEAWLGTARPGEIIPDGTPFDMPQYQVMEDSNSTRLREQAEAAVQAAQDYAQISDNYVLNTVMFAMVLFLEGISTRWKSSKIQVSMLVLAAGIFLVAVRLMLLLPISFAI